MELNYRPYRLQFLHPFGVSSNTRTETPCIFVKLRHNGVDGYGEACMPSYLGGSEDEIAGFLEKASLLLQGKPGGTNLEEMLQSLDDLPGGNNAGRAAVDIALHDLFARLGQMPVYQMLGLKKPEPSPTSYTIAIDSAEKLEQKIIEAADYPVLKIKAGTSDDKKLIRQVRRYTYKPLYVDVNQGWRDRHMVLDMIGWMKEQNVLLVEQPMPVNMLDEMAWVTQKSPLPTIADESVKVYEDLDRIKGAFSGINLKLMKCGGIRAGLRMIRKARELDMKLMLGCMAESSCGTSAMTHLMDNADFVDLDAPLLYRNDPFSGVSYRQGKICPAAGPGLGVLPKPNLVF